MEKKYKADNGVSNLLWGLVAVLILSKLIYHFITGKKMLNLIIYFFFTIFFMLSVTMKEYAITHLNFLEIRFLLNILTRNRRIPIGDIVAIKKLGPNQLRLEKVRGVEVLRVKISDIDALMNELKERNPRILIDKDEEEGVK